MPYSNRFPILGVTALALCLLPSVVTCGCNKPAGPEAGNAGAPAVPGSTGSSTGTRPTPAAAPAATADPSATAGRTVRARGNVEPGDVVGVYAQVASVVVSFGPDPRREKDPQYKGKSVVYMTPVEKGTILAQLDDGRFKAEADQERANLRRAEAELALAKARAAAAAAATAVDSKRQEAAAPAVPEPTAAQKADVAASDAAVKVAEAGVEQAKAALAKAEWYVAATTIRSPIRGVVIDRKVNFGDRTFKASVNAPSMFLVADLDRLQVWAIIKEADVGKVREGQAVRFTTEAFPGKTFTGRVAKVRFTDSLKTAKEGTSALVFTCTVEVFVNPSETKLPPYLDVDVEIDTGGGG